MKLWPVLFLFAAWGQASVDYDLISQVRTYEEKKDHIEITFWDDSRVFRPSKTHSSVACLRNAYMAQQPAALTLEEGSGIILECRLYPKAHPGTRRAL